jgi:hypothetical protein
VRGAAGGEDERARRYLQVPHDPQLLSSKTLSAQMKAPQLT